MHLNHCPRIIVCNSPKNQVPVAHPGKRVLIRLPDEKQVGRPDCSDCYETNNRTIKGCNVGKEWIFLGDHFGGGGKEEPHSVPEVWLLNVFHQLFQGHTQFQKWFLNVLHQLLFPGKDKYISWNFTMASRCLNTSPDTLFAPTEHVMAGGFQV